MQILNAKRGIFDTHTKWFCYCLPFSGLHTLHEIGKILFYFYFFGGLQCVGHSFANIAHFVFLRDDWIRTQRAALEAGALST
jgi:hypothetical protein